MSEERSIVRWGAQLQREPEHEDLTGHPMVVYDDGDDTATRFVNMNGVEAFEEILNSEGRAKVSADAMHRCVRMTPGKCPHPMNTGGTCGYPITERRCPFHGWRQPDPESYERTEPGKTTGDIIEEMTRSTFASFTVPLVHWGGRWGTTGPDSDPAADVKATWDALLGKGWRNSGR